MATTLSRALTETIVNATEILREFAFPARDITVLLSALFIFLMLKFAVFGGLLGLFLLLTFFSLTGAVVQPYNLHEEVDIHESVEPDIEVVEERLLNERTSALNHAYGFISRDNRRGGFGHIQGWLREDPDPESTWAWFFDQMLRCRLHNEGFVPLQDDIPDVLAAAERSGNQPLADFLRSRV